MKNLSSLLMFVLLGASLSSLAQSTLTFENIIQHVKLRKPYNDSNFTHNYEYLSNPQLEDFALKLLRVKEGHSAEFSTFEDIYEYRPYETMRLKSRLIIQDDSMDTEVMDENANFYLVKVPGMIDSTWYFQNLAGLESKEDWIIDTNVFRCIIKSKTYAPLVYLRGKEDLGPMSVCYIKPLTEPKSFLPVCDFIITDVYAKQDPMSDRYLDVYEANTYLDHFKLLLFMNSTIDKVKNGKLKAYIPTLPFMKTIGKKEMKTLFTDEFTPNKHEKFPVRYKMYNYRFKMVEKLSIDPYTLSLKKEALGIIIMRRNEANDLTISQDTYGITYTFTAIAYVPFNQK